jgi:subfamily B ATP-binding cassette protein HlyB/CyaB
MTETAKFTTDTTDSGLACVGLVVRFLGVPINTDEVRHKLGLGSIPLAPADLLRAARMCDVKAKLVRTVWDRLPRTPMPAVASLRDGTFTVLGKADADRVLIQDPGASTPRFLQRAEFEALWDGGLILLTKRAGFAAAGSRFGISWFVPAVWKYRRVLGEVLAASFALQILALISPLFFQVVIDKVLVHRGLSTLDILVFGLILVSGFETVLGALRTYVFAHTTNRIDVELGARLFQHLLALPMAYFGTRRVGDSVARVRELENIRNFLTGSALTLVIDLFFTFVFLGVMFWYSVPLTLIVLASFPFYIGLGAWFAPVFRRRLDEKFRRGAENQAFLVESVTGVETLKVMAVEPQMQRRWEEQLAGYVRASFNTQNLGNVASQLVGFINKATIAATLYVGAKSVISGDLTVGELVAFNMLSARVASPVLRLSQLWQDFHQVRISIDRLGDILNTPQEAGQTSRAALQRMRGDIKFEHVRFRYRIDGPEILSDIDIDIPAGQIVGIVGPSGSGKSTLAKLVERLYVPERGRVFVDGVDLALADSAWLRRQIGVVLQENILFNRSVRENIALADPGMPVEQVIAAAMLAGAHEFVLELPFGYDTVIGERGASLSGGQRQRIAIARALVTDPRILIFDEATSALDYESERIIQQNMDKIAAGRTVMIIAHRLSTVRRCDRILTIDRGRLVEDGTHEELIRTGGRYASLHRIQAGISDVI